MDSNPHDPDPIEPQAGAQHSARAPTGSKAEQRNPPYPSGNFPACFSDKQRGLRATLIGTATSTASLALLKLDEAISVGFVVAMMIDMGILLSVSFGLDADETRAIFSRLKARSSLLIERTVLLAFMSFCILSLCVKDIHDNQESHLLPIWLRTAMYFTALFLTWMQLQNGFTVYYAKKYYSLNPLPFHEDSCTQGFVFVGTDEPVFTDFLYISYAVGLTYAMSDTNLEESSIRKAVLVHSVISFLFYSTFITAILNLVTSG